MQISKVIFMRSSSPVFPRGKDMLRYDVAFVSRDDHTLVAFPTFKGGGGGRCTLARWASFHLTLRAEGGTRLEQALAKDALAHDAEKWTTYLHPRIEPDGPTDYGRLEPVTLARFLEPKRKNYRDVDTDLVPGPMFFLIGAEGAQEIQLEPWQREATAYELGKHMDALRIADATATDLTRDGTGRPYFLIAILPDAPPYIRDWIHFHRDDRRVLRLPTEREARQL